VNKNEREFSKKNVHPNEKSVKIKQKECEKSERESYRKKEK